MMPTENYLPEWKLYLLKKLALDSKKLSDRPLTTREFLYVTDQEIRNAMMESLQQEDTFIRGIYDRVLAGERIQENADNIAFSKAYTPPEFKSINIIGALMELSEEQDAPLSILDPHLGKEYFVTQEKKRLASRSSGTWTKGDAEVLPSDTIVISKLKSLLNKSPGLSDHIVFRLGIDQTKINKKIQEYLNAFNEQRLIPPKGKRYLAVEEQKARFLKAIGVLEKKFGKNILTNFAEIIQIGGRGNWREESCRFYETLFLLEQEGIIKIIDLRGLEVVFSIIQSPKPERRRIEPFDIEREFAKVKKMTDPAEHLIAQEKWLNVKFILGEISKILPPIKSGMRQYLTLKTDSFSDVQKDLLSYVMEYLLDIGGVHLPPQPQPIIVVTSKPLMKVLSGEFAVIGDQEAIEEYISQVYELCNLIEKDARAKFLRRDAPPISKTSKEKILKVLDVIHGRYELAPKEPQLQNHGTTITYGDGGGKMKIVARDFLAGGEINFHELEAILGMLKEEGLLNSFELIPEYL
jgi:hypothetical protein